MSVVQAPVFDIKSATKPIYMVVADSYTDESSTFYLATKLDRNENSVVIKGQKLTKAQADKLSKEPTPEAKTEIEVEIPWSKIRRIENLTYKPKAQGEKK